jgi:phytoene desaturase
MKTKKPRRIAVIGGGVGGLAAAIRLASAGHDVEVFEKGPNLGGKLNILDIDGFRFDTGPSLLTLPWVFAELFQAAGESINNWLEIKPLSPICRYFYPDSTSFDASSNLAEMTQNLDTFSPGSAADFLGFLGHAARAWRSSRQPFLESTITTPLDFIKDGIPWHDLDALLPWPSLDALARRFFRDPKLWPFIGRYATYTGSSPYLAPGTLSTVLYSEYAYGGWYITGGMYRLAEQLVALAKKLGVRLHTNQEVKRLVLRHLGPRQSQVQGVQLAAQVHNCDIVIANADAAHLYGDLLPPQLDPRPKQLSPSLSGFVLLLGITGEVPGLAHHNVFFSNDYRREFTDIFDLGRPSRNPTVYVSITSKTDPSQAPAGHENWFVLVNAPPTGQVDWVSGAANYQQLILNRLGEHGFDIRNRIISQHCITPADLEQKYRAWRGGIYGTSSNGASSAFLRPANRSPHVRGLYLASGSAHPGGGLPLVALSGKLAAEAVLADEARGRAGGAVH